MGTSLIKGFTIDVSCLKVSYKYPYIPHMCLCKPFILNLFYIKKSHKTSHYMTYTIVRNIERFFSYITRGRGFEKDYIVDKDESI